MINESFIDKSHSSIVPNDEIAEGVQSHMKMDDEDCLEILHSFEKHYPKDKFPKIKEFNFLETSQHRDMTPHVDHTHLYWLKHLGLESHLIESISHQKKRHEMNWVKPEDHLNHNTGDFFHTVCSPNAPGIYGFRRLQLHQESGLPARHYKPTLKNGVFSWGENFNLKLPPVILSPETSSSNSSSSCGTAPTPHFFREPFRRVPSAVKSLLTERAHLLNLSNGTYYLDSGQPIFPTELSDGDRVLRLASAHLLVEGVPKEFLYSPKRKTQPNDQDSSTVPEEPPPSDQSNNLHHLSLVGDEEEVHLIAPVEAEPGVAESEERRDQTVELEEKNDAQGELINEPVTETHLGERHGEKENPPNEDELPDLLGSAQVSILLLCPLSSLA
jgi:hypothetical protein